MLYCEGLKTCNCFRQIDVTYAFLGTFAKLKSNLLCNNPEELGFQQLHGESLKSHIVSFVVCVFTWNNSAPLDRVA
jgi:hypothetical protein